MFVSCLLTKDHLGQDYEIRSIHTRPADLGYDVINRDRMYYLLVHKKFGKFVSDPGALYECLSAKIKGILESDLDIDSLFWEDSEAELRKELLNGLTPNRAGDMQIVSKSDWTPFLTDWERENLDAYTTSWMKKASSLKGAVFVLSQSASHHKTWSFRPNGKPALPTLFLCLQYFLYTEICIYIAYIFTSLYIHISAYIYIFTQYRSIYRLKAKKNIYIYYVYNVSFSCARVKAEGQWHHTLLAR